MSGHKMTKLLRIIKQALKDESVMGFGGLGAFEKAYTHLKKRKLIEGGYPVQVLYTKVDGKEYACCLFGDRPNDIWGIVQLTPKVDAYIGKVYKKRWVGHEVSPPEELICE